ncbi:hypothetical protein QG37_04825 [Candidozyma auris]|uniref:Uncharacterized protein n=1 Tax=Candidozyma auris TaxID=498019 RepID=A0A0L0NXB5_CANAR|nr:hypothetical protein QG37_04825 [[Candida] auris]
MGEIFGVLSEQKDPGYEALGIEHTINQLIQIQ